MTVSPAVCALLVAGLVLLAIVLLFFGRGRAAWALPLVLAVALLGALAVPSPWVLGAAAGVALLLLLFAFPPIRRQVVTRAIFPLLRAAFPKVSETERAALESGTVWWDAELFSGRPRWPKLLGFEVQGLSPKEQAFLDGPVEELCRRLDDWKLSQKRDLPPEIWAFLKEKRFFGLIIPPEFGGLGFSARAHSDVIVKVASRSVATAVVVMVPNSLGPAELLLHYGTDAQKRHYLPRLATGAEIPCFALTGPEAGSDAAATQSVGIICRGTFEGKEVLGMRLSWNKRYITLAPVATLIGLAFRLRDPDHLLGETEDLGITCALIPAHLPGVEIGLRHDPMGIAFPNGPTSARDVFVPLDFIIGGRARAGGGWQMLMESLAAGRAISLPSLAVAGAQLAARVCGAYATVREQFDNPIGRFEGIEEPLARIGGLTYLMDAARRLTLGAVDSGQKPAVISAIVKAYLTESMRAIAIDAMDIRAGAAICRGPRNILARFYTAAPIAITVEGANILTRSMIIYGQGAIRCHPFVQAELTAAAKGDLTGLDRAFFGHVNHVMTNATRAFLLGLFGARLAQAPVSGPLAGYFRAFSRLSAAFALVSDTAMGLLGGRLKRKEKLSGRLADALAWMYLGTAALKRGHETDLQDLPFVRWSAEHAIYRIQVALDEILAHLPLWPVRWLLRRLIFPWGLPYRPPSDRLGAAVARDLLEDREARIRLTTGIFVPPHDEPGLGHLEAALARAVPALAVEKKVRDAVRAGRLDRAPGDALLDAALAAGVITPEERQAVTLADEIRNEVIQVDAFSPQAYRELRP